MSLETRKEQIRKEIERKAAYLDALEALPDFELMPEGTVLGLEINYGQRRSFPVVGFKINGMWQLAGQNGSPRSDADLAEWVMSQGRRLVSSRMLGEYSVAPAPIADLGEALARLEQMPEFKVRGNKDSYTVVAEGIKREFEWKALADDGYPDGVR